MSVSFQLSVVRNGCRKWYLNYTENDWNGGLQWPESRSCVVYRQKQDYEADQDISSIEVGGWQAQKRSCIRRCTLRKINICNEAWKKYRKTPTVTRVRTIPVLGYWELGDICIYRVISVSGDIFLAVTPDTIWSVSGAVHMINIWTVRSGNRRQNTARGVGEWVKTKVQAVIHGR